MLIRMIALVAALIALLLPGAGTADCPDLECNATWWASTLRLTVAGEPVMGVVAVGDVVVPECDFWTPPDEPDLGIFYCDLIGGTAEVTYPDGAVEVVIDDAPYFGSGEPGHCDPHVELGSGYEVTLDDGAAILFAAVFERPDGSDGRESQVSITVLTPDFDGDGDVDVGDLLHLVDAWGGPHADLTKDGTTNVPDLLTLLSWWGG